MKPASLCLLLPLLALAACNSSGQQQRQAQPTVGAGSFNTLQQQGQGQAQAAAVAVEEARPNVITIGDRSGAPAATFTRTGDSWIMEKGAGATEPYQIHEEWTPDGPNRLMLISQDQAIVWTFDLDSMQATLSHNNGPILDQFPVLLFN